MNDEQFTALAREYGEYVANSLDYDMRSDPELSHRLVAKVHSESAQLVLEWLSHRFCLVEKEAVRKEYHEIKLALGDGGRSEWEDDINMGKEALLKSLFPGIAKDMENQI